MLARTILRLAKKNKGVTGSTAPPVQRVGGDAGSSPATSTDPEDWDVEYYDFSFFQPVCVCCGRIVLSGGFGFERDGMLLAAHPAVERYPHEETFVETVRFRTVGDATCTGAIRSTAATVAEVLAETRASDVSERGASRADDRTSEAAMEDRKREGYF